MDLGYHDPWVDIPGNAAAGFADLGRAVRVPAGRLAEFKRINQFTDPQFRHWVNNATAEQRVRVAATARMIASEAGLSGAGVDELWQYGGLGDLGELGFLKKFFKNNKNTIASLTSFITPVASFIPGAGTAVAAVSSAAGNIAQGYLQQQQQAQQQQFLPPPATYPQASPYAGWGTPPGGPFQIPDNPPESSEPAWSPPPPPPPAENADMKHLWWQLHYWRRMAENAEAVVKGAKPPWDKIPQGVHQVGNVPASLTASKIISATSAWKMRFQKAELAIQQKSVRGGSALPVLLIGGGLVGVLGFALLRK